MSSASTAAAVMKAVALARAHGTRVVLDIDYRPVLWGLTAAGDGDPGAVVRAGEDDLRRLAGAGRIEGHHLGPFRPGLL